ncbi:MAG: hypothetical protein Q8L81_04320 [Bacteroidota bacterium]|nr:hypothetical protein [Bacteroidota bacterium]
MVFKKIAFGISLILMALPLLETEFKIFDAEGLKGAFYPKIKPVLNDSDWFSGDYQKQAEEYLTDTVGLRNVLLRLNNQIDYSLYEKLHAYDIVVGKENSLQATTHFDAYLGKSGAPRVAYDSMSYKLVRLQDTLKKLNKFLFFIVAPGKGSYDLERAPYYYNTKKAGRSFYDELTENFDKQNVNYLDFNKIFLARKKSAERKEYTDYGIHWARHTAAWTFDTILRYIESRSVYTALPRIENVSYFEIDTALRMDVDLTSSLNLMFPYKFHHKFYDCRFGVRKVNDDKLNLMAISDSYDGTFTSVGMASHTFDTYSSWYYFKTVYRKNDPNSYQANALDLKEEINKANVIFIMATIANLDNPGWGFVDKAYAIYFP